MLQKNHLLFNFYSKHVYLSGCSKAVLCLGQLSLSCSEEQLQALVELLSHSLAFGLMSSWGTDVFMEIGVLAGTLKKKTH